MLSIGKGYDIAYLTDQVKAARADYYTGTDAAGEPAGMWHGAAAEALGLSGEIDPELMEAIYMHGLDPADARSRSRSTWGQADHLGAAPPQYRSAEQRYAEAAAREPHATPERRAELQRAAERTTRQPVAFFDLTFSPPKSVTVLAAAFERAEHEARRNAERAEQEGRTEQADRYRTEQAAWAEHRSGVEQAVLAGARAAVDYLQEHAGYGRVGHHGGGAGRWIDSHRWLAGQFLQHDSRDGDPQLHVHQPVLNKQLCADGQWRALDGRAIYTWRPAAAAHGERHTEAELYRLFGIRSETRPDGKARELVGIPEAVMDLFRHGGAPSPR